MLKLDINLLWTVVNVLVMYAVLRKFLFKPVQDVLDKRQQMVDASMADAQEAQNKAQAALSAAEDKLHNVDIEAAQLRQSSEKQAEKQKEQLLADAQRQAGQRQDIEGNAGEIHQHNGKQHAQRHTDGHDDGRAQVLQKQRQYDDGQRCALDQVGQHTIDDELDIVALVHDGRQVQALVFGHHRFHRRAAGVGDRRGGRCRALVQRQQHGTVLVHLGVGVVGVVGHFDLGHIGQAHVADAVDIAEHHAFQLVRVGKRALHLVEHNAGARQNAAPQLIMPALLLEDLLIFINIRMKNGIITCESCMMRPSFRMQMIMTVLNHPHCNMQQKPLMQRCKRKWLVWLWSKK